MPSAQASYKNRFKVSFPSVGAQSYRLSTVDAHTVALKSVMGK